MNIEFPTTARGRGAIAAALLTLTVLLTAAADAKAAVYQWTANSDGNWTNPANWQLIEGTPGAGYPNAPGDVAHVGGPSTTGIRKITIDGVIVTVGVITMKSPFRVVIQSTPGGRLDLNNGGQPARIERFIVPTDGDYDGMLVPIRLLDSLVIEYAPQTSGLSLNEMIGEAGGVRSVTKRGSGRLSMGSKGNEYTGPTTIEEGLGYFVGPSSGAQPAPYVFGSLTVGNGVAGDGTALAIVRHTGQIAPFAPVTVNGDGELIIGAVHELGTLTVNGGLVTIQPENGLPTLTVTNLLMTGGTVRSQKGSRLRLAGAVTATSNAAGPAAIALSSGEGYLDLNAATRTFMVSRGPAACDLEVSLPIIQSIAVGIAKDGNGCMRFTGDKANMYNGQTTLRLGTLELAKANGAAAVPGRLVLVDGTLAGTGTVGALTGEGGRVAPGTSPGRLSTGPLVLSATTTVAMEVTGPTPGSGYDQLVVTGTVNLAGARLELIAAGNIPAIPAIVLIDNDGTDAVTGTFAGLAEGATIETGGRTFRLTYRGGDGNDVALTDITPLSYYLAEGATGAFFDDDVLIANPNDREAPVTLTFLREGGSTVVERRTIPAQARLTVQVDRIAGLEDASASVQVTPDKQLPLVVERSMFWDASYYGGHTANAVAKPERRWIFAEGFQGFFDTYILIANTNAEATTATLTFLRESDTPFVATVEIPAFARKTVWAGDYPEVAGRAFGILVEATRPVIAERAMYFASAPGRLWAGGHVNAGIVAPSTSWFHAEGATGGFFSTFILLSNPNTSPANVELKFLLSTGEVITRTKTIGANQRLTINPATEGDQRLENAAVSTVVTSDVPIVSERSMYWPGEVGPFGEGHNSSGVVSLATKWGLAEGRVGGPRQFDTYILLANPGTQDAQVSITYLPEGGAAITRTYTVKATSRFNVDVKTAVPELQNTSFGARIESTNGVPIVVERSVYWNAAGVFWAGGSNALGTPLP